MSEIVFVLGAGASATAGAPLMATFLDNAYDLLRTERTGDRRDAFQTVFDSIGALQAAQAKADIDLRNIEAIFTLFEMAQLVAPDYFTQRGISGDPVVAIKKMIVHTLEELILFPTDRGAIQAPADYKNFAKVVRRLRTRGRPNRSVAVLTFNYDMCLDVAVHRSSMQCKYFLDDADRMHPIALPVLKLHGSLNWLQRPDDGSITVFRLENANIRWEGGLYDGSIKMPISEHARDARYWDSALPDGVPFLVPPTINKSEHHRAITSVWRQAAKELGGSVYFRHWLLTSGNRSFLSAAFRHRVRRCEPLSAIAVV